MRKIYSLIALLILLAMNSTITQAQTYTFGTGTATNSNISGLTPLQDYYENSKSQTLITAAELSSKGVTTGQTFNSVSWNITALNGAGVIEGLTIKYKWVALTALTASFQTGTTTFYGPVDYQPVTGVNTFSFSTGASTPWNGTDALLIETYNSFLSNSSVSTYSYNPSITQSPTTPNTFLYARADNQTTTYNPTTGTVGTTRPNISVTFVNNAPCSGTPALATASASPNSGTCSVASATISATGYSTGTGLSYQWQSSTNGGTSWSNAGSSTTSYSNLSVSNVTTTTLYRLVTTCSNGGNSRNSLNTTITINDPVGGTAYIGSTGTTTTLTGCTGISYTIRATGYTSTGVTYQWQRATDAAFSQNLTNVTTASSTYTNLSTSTLNASGTYFYRLKVLCSTGGSPGYSSTATLTLNQTPTAVSATNDGPKCPGVDVNLSGSATGATTYAWSGPNSFTASTQNAVITAPTTAAAGVYTLTATNNGCSATATTTVSFLAAPVISSVTANPTIVCNGGSTTLTANLSASGMSATTVYSENFNAATNGWTAVNNSTGGTPANADWTLRADGYSYGSTPTVFHSNDNSQFYMSNSDAQGSGSTTFTTLTSPTIALPTAPNLNLSFKHYFYTSDSGVVRISLDGTSWVNLAKYTTTTGSAANFASANLDLSAYAGHNVYIQFKYHGTYDWYWAIDNVSITSTANPTYSWSDGTNIVGTTNPLTVSPTANTTYTVTVSNGTCSTTGSVAVTMATPLTVTGSITNAANSLPRCSANSTTAVGARLDGVATGGNGTYTYVWSTPNTPNDLFTTNTGSTAYTTGYRAFARPAATTTYTLTVTDGCGTTATTTVTVEVNETPVVTATNNGPACSGASLQLTGTSTVAGATYAWSGPNGYTSTDLSPTISNIQTNGAGTYSLIATNNGCASTAATTSVVVNASPTAVTVTPSSATICGTGSVVLTASGGEVSQQTTLLSENFNSANNNWTKTNTSTGGTTPAAADWTLRPNGYQNTGGTTVETFHSNDNSQFYLSNSDAVGSGANVNTTLVSPLLDLTNMQSASLNFNHYFKAPGTASVEISIDGGSSWNTLQSYTTLQGSATSFSSATLSLNSYLGNSNVKIRFKYTAGWNWYWAIDNVTISGTEVVSANFTWSPTGGTVSGTHNEINTVSPTTTITYTASVTGANGCTASASATVSNGNPATNVALAPAGTTTLVASDCEDNGWTYYKTSTTSSELYFAIQWSPTNTPSSNATAKAAAVPTITLDAAPFAAEDAANDRATYTMRRYWNVDLNGETLDEPVNVRFFYDASEKTEIETMAANFAAANTANVEPSEWFKTVDYTFVPNSTNVTPDLVVNAIALTDVNTANNTINGVLYAQFDGIGSFSGGTFATGVGLGTPTPIHLVNFTGTKASEALNKLEWTVSCTDNRPNTIELQRSNTNGSFTKLYSVVTSPANCGSAFDYNDAAPLNGNNYYRLKMIDADGVIKYSHVVLLNNSVKGAGLISLSPNPAKEVTTVRINSLENKTVNLNVVDATGRTVIRQSASLVAGQNNIRLDLSRLAEGMYQVVVIDKTGVLSTEKLSKQ